MWCFTQLNANSYSMCNIGKICCVIIQTVAIIVQIISLYKDINLYLIKIVNLDRILYNVKKIPQNLLFVSSKFLQLDDLFKSSLLTKFFLNLYLTVQILL